MAMTFYFFYQAGDGQPWGYYPSDYKREFLEKSPPPLVSVLDSNNNFEDKSMSQREKNEVRYKGPMYFDFDAEDIQEAIEDFQATLTKLKGMGVVLESLDLYATGGRGFHIEIPLKTMYKNLPTAGIQAMHLVAKQLAFRMQVRSMDLRIYSCRRLWRVPNVKRSNGRYKVPITAAEAMSMTEEMYIELTSAPRPPQPRVDPVYAPDFVNVWNNCITDAEKAIKISAKNAKRDTNLLRAWGSDWSDTLKDVLDGKSLREDVGFNQISVQLAITAHALGKTEEQFLKDAEGLMQSHHGTRYGTYHARRRELINQYVYMAEATSYAFSAGAIKVLLDPKVEAPDLTALATVPVTPGETVDQVGTHNGVSMSRAGIFTMSDDGDPVQRCKAALVNPVEIFDRKKMEAGNDMRIASAGFRVSVYYEGEYLEDGHFWGSSFGSRASFQRTLGNYIQAGVSLNDHQVGALMDILSMQARKEKRLSITVGKEGLNIIDIPKITGYTDKRIRDVVWVSPHRQITLNVDPETGEPMFTYTYRGPFGVTEPIYNSDLMEADKLSTLNPETAYAYFHHLMHLNEEENMARMIAWFSACHFAPWIREYFGQFPHLHPFGGSGAAKSTTVKILARMHFNTRKVVLSKAVTTKFSLEAGFAGSGSIPFILDEYKASDMTDAQYSTFQDLVRNAYTGASVSKGGVNSQVGDGLSIRSETLTAPMCFMGEQRETQKAIRDRSVSIHLDPDMLKGRRVHADHVVYCTDSNEDDSDTRSAKYLGPLGKHLAVMALNTKREDFVAEFKKIFVDLRTKYENSLEPGDAQSQDRPLHNAAVLIYGMRKVRKALQVVIGDRLEAHLERMESLIGPDMPLTAIDAAVASVVREGSETGQVIAAFAMMSSLDPDDKHRIRYGEHYCDSPHHEGCIDIKVRYCFMVYQQWIRSRGEKPLFQNQFAFMTAISKYRATAAISVLHSALKKTAGGEVVRFNLAKLKADGVGEFSNEP